MEKITKVLLAECGKNIKFQLGEEQLEILTDEFDTILAQMKFLHEIPGLDSVEPMTFPYKNRVFFQIGRKIKYFYAEYTLDICINPS